MPILPPRNLPFTPPESSSKRSSHTPTSADSRVVASSTNTTPTKSRNVADDGTGVLPRQEESTYHRKLRSLLWDFRRAYEKWIDLISLQGAKAIASMARLAASLDEHLAKEAKEVPKDPRSMEAEATHRRNKRLDEIAEIMEDVRGVRMEIEDVMDKISMASMKFIGLSEAAESLLIDATQAKGSDFTFEKEMWVSWSMDKFVWALQLVSSRCIIQTSHLQYLSDTLCKEGCAPGAPLASQLIEEDKRKGRNDEEAEEETVQSDDESEEEGDRYTNKLKRKGRRRVREKVLEEWRTLAFLHDEKSKMDAELFEDICEVEVGRYEER